jgi:hypothetical protein
MELVFLGLLALGAFVLSLLFVESNNKTALEHAGGKEPRSAAGTAGIAAPEGLAEYGYAKKWTVDDVMARDLPAAKLLHDGKAWDQALAMAAHAYQVDRYADAHYLFVHCASIRPDDPEILVNFGSNMFQLACYRNSLAYFDASFDALERGMRADRSGSLRRQLQQHFDSSLAQRGTMVSLVLSEDTERLKKFNYVGTIYAAMDATNHSSLETFKNTFTGNAARVITFNTGKQVRVEIYNATGVQRTFFEQALVGDVTQWPIQIKSLIFDAKSHERFSEECLVRVVTSGIHLNPAPYERFAATVGIKKFQLIDAGKEASETSPVLNTTTSAEFALDVESLEELIAAIKDDPDRILKIDGWDNPQVAIKNLESMLKLRGTLRNDPHAAMYKDIDNPSWYEFHILTGNAYGIDVVARPNKPKIAPEDRVLPDLPGRKPETPLGQGLVIEAPGPGLQCRWEGHDLLRSLKIVPESGKVHVYLADGNHFLSRKMQELICVDLGARAFVMHDRRGSDFTDSYEFDFDKGDHDIESFIRHLKEDDGRR